MNRVWRRSSSLRTGTSRATDLVHQQMNRANVGCARRVFRVFCNNARAPRVESRQIIGQFDNADRLPTRFHLVAAKADAHTYTNTITTSSARGRSAHSHRREHTSYTHICRTDRCEDHDRVLAADFNVSRPRHSIDRHVIARE